VSKAWKVLDRRDSFDGVLELRQRDADDFLICVDGRVLMNSRASRSEVELGVRTCSGLGPESRVLVGGLGMGLTLRAVLDSLPETAAVTVAELHEVVAEWCRGPLAGLCAGALGDSRVSLRIGDLADRIREAADGQARYDAIVMDLFEGPHARTDAKRDPFYGRQAIERSWRALSPGGVLGVWAEAPDKGFEARLRAQGFAVEANRPGRGGLRHWIVLARRPATRATQDGSPDRLKASPEGSLS
jgi:spermidine synthase